jgi:hypothetical protein
MTAGPKGPALRCEPMKLARLVLVMSWCAAAVTPAAAETYAVRVVRDVPYLQGANYADGKDTLDLYLPGRPHQRARQSSPTTATS